MSGGDSMLGSTGGVFTYASLFYERVRSIPDYLRALTGRLPFRINTGLDGYVYALDNYGHRVDESTLQTELNQHSIDTEIRPLNSPSSRSEKPRNVLCINSVRNLDKISAEGSTLADAIDSFAKKISTQLSASQTTTAASATR